MEAVPRLYMSSFDLKLSPSNVNFSSTLKKYIRSHYQENPDSYDKEIRDLENLRQSACKVSLDFTGCSVLKRYFAQLNFLQNRFPMTDDGPVCVPFTWSDIYSGATFSITDIKYEQACILYNIGALHSKLGAEDKREDAEGMKLACTHFQCAAWAFQHLKDTYPQPKGSDMAHDILTFMSNTMLAQAQECILEKSMLDSRKSSIIAKVAAQVVDYYRSAFGVLMANSSGTSSVNDVVGSRLYKIWKKYIEFKMSYYTSVSHFYMGNQCEEQQKMGERVSWFQSGMEHLNEAIKLSKAVNRTDVNESLSFLTDIIGGKLSASKKENDFVYHAKVLPLDSLPELKGASLVKGIPFNPSDPDVCGNDIFVRLVPMETHSYSSVYSEEKAKILRAINVKIEERNEDLSTFMSSLHMEGDMFEDVPISQELMEKCAALRVRPTAVSDLTDLMNELVEISHKVEVILTSCRNLLVEEEKKESKHQEIFGKRVTSMITVELKKECAKFEEAQKKAAESNTTLQNVANAYIDKLKVLSGPISELRDALPTVETVRSGMNNKEMQEYMKLLQKVDEMQEQRNVLQEQLRNALQNDDITKRLMGMDDRTDVEKVFHDELKKHDQTLTYINQNLIAQDNILHALTEANARFADMRKSVISIKKERQAAVASFIGAFEAYEDLMLKAKKGLEFFEKLKTNVSRLFDRIRSVTRVQEEEREQRTGAQRIKEHVPVDAHLPATVPHAPKLKDYLPHMANRKVMPSVPLPTAYPHAYPQPVGSYNLPTVPPDFVNPSNPNVLPHALNTGIDNKTQVYQTPATYKGDPKFDIQSDYNKLNFAKLPNVPYNASMNGQHTYYNSASNSTDGSSIIHSTVPYVSSGGQMQPNTPYVENTAARTAVLGQNQMYQSYIPHTAAQYSQLPIAPAETKNYSNRNVEHPGTFTQPAYYSNMVQPAYSGQKTTDMSQPQNPTYSTQVVSQPAYSGQTTNMSQPQNPTYSTQVASQPAYSGQTTNMSQPQNPTYSTQVMSQPAYSGQTTNMSQPQNPTYSTQVASQPAYSGQTTNMSQPQNSTYNTQVPVQPAYSGQKTTNISQPQIPMSEGHVNPNYSTQVQPNNYSYSYVSPSVNYMMPSTVNTSIPQAVVNAANTNINSAYPGYPNTVQANQTVSTNYTFSNYSSMPYGQGYSQANEQIVYGQTSNNSTNFNQAIPPSSIPTATEQNYAAYHSNGMLFDPPPNLIPPLSAVQEILPTKVKPANVETNEKNMVTSQTESQKPKVESPRSESYSNSLSSVAKETPKSSESMLKEQLNLTLLKPKEESLQPSVRDCLEDESTRTKFVSDVEKFEKHVEGLVRKSLNGTTPLDQKWKDLNDVQEKESRKMSISVARCYPLKNRVPDIMPYDINRVKLTSSKDDYINASYLKDLLPNCPTCIITQSPLPSTYSDFWLMVWEQQVETVVCLLSLNELKTHVYWPKERNQSMACSTLDVVLQSQKENGSITERIINITNNKNKVSRVVVHLQFNTCPASQLPGVSDVLKFVSEVLSFHKQQRSLLRPLVVHCSSGVGRSGLFCLLLALVSEINNGHGPREVTNVAARMCQQRKYIIQDKDHLKFSYETALSYALNQLHKRGIAVKKSSFGDVSSLYSVSSAKDDLQLGVVSGITSMKSLDSGNQPESKEDTVSATTTEGSCIAKEKVEDVEKSPIKISENIPVVPDDESTEKSETHSTSNSPSKDKNEDMKNTVNVVQKPTSVTSILDPMNFTLDTQDSSGKRKITKDMFLNHNKSLECPGTDVNDPLSKLNPLWSMKKQ